MATTLKRKRLLDAYRFPFFRPLEKIRSLFGDSKARIITLVRRSKKQSVTPVVGFNLVGTTRRFDKFAISLVAAHASIWRSRFDWVLCRYFATVKRERLDFLSDNPLYTKRFAWYVGRRCRNSTVKPSLGFVEGLNNKIRVIQRREYGLCDEEYLRLKILTSMLPIL